MIDGLAPANLAIAIDICFWCRSSAPINTEDASRQKPPAPPPHEPDDNINVKNPAPRHVFFKRPMLPFATQIHLQCGFSKPPSAKIFSGKALCFSTIIYGRDGPAPSHDVHVRTTCTLHILLAFTIRRKKLLPPSSLLLLCLRGHRLVDRRIDHASGDEK